MITITKDQRIKLWDNVLHELKVRKSDLFLCNILESVMDSYIGINIPVCRDNFPEFF